MTQQQTDTAPIELGAKVLYLGVLNDWVCEVTGMLPNGRITFGRAGRLLRFSALPAAFEPSGNRTVPWTVKAKFCEVTDEALR